MPKPNGELSLYEIEKQDIVDSACYELITQFTPNGLKDVEWNIEQIAKIREALQEVIVDDLKLMTEQEFYPYVELDNDGNFILEPYEPKPERLVVTLEQLDKAIKGVVDELDFDELAKVAGDFLGGLCVWDEGDNFIFVTDENYNGGLDFIKD
jgi:hypothetical protein